MKLPPTITSRTNGRVKELRAAFSGQASQPGEMVAIEGEHLIAEALRSGLTLDTVYLREGSERVLQRAALAGLRAENWVVLSVDAFDSAAGTASPQGLAATLAIPHVGPLEEQASAGMLLVLEDLQDPGNLGTLLRSAEAFGVRRVYATPATVRAWNPKAVRASAGSVFRIPVRVARLAEIATELKRGGVRLVAAVAGGEGAAAVMDADLVAPCALMIGNEGAGLSGEALAAAQARVHIPCAVESLNAAIAGSMLLYEAARQNGKLSAHYQQEER